MGSELFKAAERAEVVLGKNYIQGEAAMDAYATLRAALNELKERKNGS